MANQITDDMLIKMLRIKLKTNCKWVDIAKEMDIPVTNIHKRRERLKLKGALRWFEKRAEELENGVVETKKKETEAIENDPRSPACRKVKTCWASRCYLHRECPAFAAWQNRRKENNSYMTSIIS